MNTHHTRNRHGGAGAARGILSRAALLLALAVPATGCDILDVENPNNLVQEDVQRRPAATAMVNGALSTVARGIGYMSAPYSTTTDELTWIGSRDAWNQLDQGNITDPANEFADAAFPYLAEGRWMADQAIEIVSGHLEEENTAAMRENLARAYLVGGVAYTAVADMMDDFVFSNRREAAEPKGPENMGTVYDDAISYLNEAASMAQADGLTNLEANAIAMRARAKHAKAVWQKIQGSAPSDPLVDAGADDAGTVVGMKGFEDWMYRLTFSGSTVDSDVAFQVNERGELQLGTSVVTRNDDDSIDEFILTDPITGEVDTRLRAAADEFLASSQYAPITQASNREMHLILAESRLAQDDMDGFIEHINHVRVEITGTEEYTGPGQVAAEEMLEHERRVNLYLQNRRLADLYRFGTQAAEWQSGSAAATTPGLMLPITLIEIRANPNISG